MVSNQFLVAVLSSAPQGSAGVKPVSAAGIRDANAVHSTAILFPGAPDNCPKLRHIEMRHLLSPLRYLAVECWGTDFKDEGIFFGFMLFQHWFIFSAKARVYQVHFCIATFSLVFNTPGEYASDSLVSWRADSRPFKTRSTNGKRPSLPTTEFPHFTLHALVQAVLLANLQKLGASAAYIGYHRTRIPEGHG